jgi:hypothetical protein
MRVAAIKRAKSLASRRSMVQVAARFKDFNESSAFLRKLADSYGRDRAIRELTVDIITAECDSRDKVCQALACARWVQENVYYVHEGFETFQTPTTTARELAGDCDDMSTLICAMLNSIGIRNTMCIIAIGGRWAHIFPVALIPTKGEMHRLTLDATLQDSVDDMVNPIAKVKASGRVVTKVKFV